MDTLGRRIKQLRNGKGLTQKELANELGISRDTLASWEVDRREPDYRTIITIADYFGVSLDFLLAGRSCTCSETVQPGQQVEVPIYGSMKYGEPVMSREEIEGYVAINKDTAGSGEYFFLKVTDDSMAGDDIKPGSLVLVLKQPVVEEGQIAVAAVKDAEPEITIKRIYFRDDQCVLVPSNSKYGPQVFPTENVKIIGRVVEVRFKV